MLNLTFKIKQISKLISEIQIMEENLPEQEAFIGRGINKVQALKKFSLGSVQTRCQFHQSVGAKQSGKCSGKSSGKSCRKGVALFYSFSTGVNPTNFLFTH